MNIYDRITTYIITRLYKRMFISRLYETNVGIKNINEIISSDIFEFYPANKFLTIGKDALWLSFDALKDKYTLLGTPLIDSPHYNLVKAIMDRKDIVSIDYLDRRKNGTLDILAPCNINENFIRFLIDQYHKRKSVIESGEYIPIKVKLIGGKYYIADGKHRAAFCAVLDVPIKCVDITPLIFDSYLWWVYKKMLKNKFNYKKHIQWFDEAKKVIL